MQYLVNSWHQIVELISIHKRLRAFQNRIDGSRDTGRRDPVDFTGRDGAQIRRLLYASHRLVRFRLHPSCIRVFKAPRYSSGGDPCKLQQPIYA